ncbi:MAG TPA: Mth938-like domain-containing protein [Casimicrobiaceae bacterium]|nr:Mth938-like domain-containing protein [Casimicrobiaceae bacterium]
MKFHLSTAAGNVVTGLGPGWIRIGADEYRENVVLTSDAVATGWAAAGFDGLTADDFAQLLAQKPEVVLFGAGPTIRFPHPRLTRALTDAGVGVEVMDTPAACRTFNILAAEGRSVVAALLVK